MTFVMDRIVAKTAFGDVLSLPGGYGKERFTNAKIEVTKSIITDICIHILSDNKLIDKNSINFIYTDIYMFMNIIILQQISYIILLLYRSIIFF